MWTGEVRVLQGSTLVVCNNCLDCFRSLGFPCLCLVSDQEGDSKPLLSPKPKVGRTAPPAASAATRSRRTEPEGWDTLGTRTAPGRTGMHANGRFLGARFSDTARFDPNKSHFPATLRD